MTRKLGCPRCRQDRVTRVIIKPLNREILLCPECDAFWWSETEVSGQSFEDYGSYITSKGSSEDWSLLEELCPIEVEKDTP